jgi:hypothetical protein
MKQLLSKYIFFYRKLGLVLFFKKIFTSILYRIKTKFFTYRLVRSNLSLKNKFTAIYQKTKAEGFESISGEGSSLTYTLPLRESLPVMLSHFKIKSIFDGPCGDFNWMKEIMRANDIAYQGVDIVSDIIDSNIRKYSSKRINFAQGDLTQITFPQSDLMIMRDLLFHLSYEDSRVVIKFFLESNINFLLITSHMKINKNVDIYSGDFKFINLFEPPYCFPKNPLWTIDDWVPPYPERKLLLFSREQLLESKVFSFPGYDLI